MSEIKYLYVIDWMGPYSSMEEMYNREGSENCFIYLITGRGAYERSKGIKYVGITGREVYKRINDKDHLSKQQLINEMQYWIGRYSRVSDNNLRWKRAELVEYCLVRYLYSIGVPLINTKKTKTNPSLPIVVISRWQKGKKEEARLNKPSILSKLPDTILYADDEFWTSNKLRISNPIQ